ncbi:alpha/beta fold hydrolase [Aurantiacibacter poecillastricola]|uniref:alpha/beta fold hydrolase n=1 Tax=Aurantiacibacter poecillastricola TaxID=3064385 RepID=UPI00273D5555|nr:alpha/beta hydrolase [Aurantiacibacter sp. 219JJ12-13]MDP5262831.1 alpha/beta hydrolase [Aurantiacibacter sp. 219JJ12-13]
MRPPAVFEPCASAYGLPKSNHRQEVGISQADTLVPAKFDRRAIPASASERTWFAEDGHKIRIIDWSEPPEGVRTRGSILFMAGRGDAYEKYIESFEHWRLKGWRVSAADWRGQAGSGRLGRDDATGHVDDFRLWVNDLAQLWAHFAQGREGPLVLMGHSMGGHLVLRAAIEKVLMPRPDALVLSAPMLDVFPEHLPLFMKRGFAHTMARMGDDRRPAWGKGESPLAMDKFRQNLLTHDADRYEDEIWWRAKRPELKLGAGSWGWVRGAMDSIRAIHARGAPEGVDLPVFVVATEADRLVSPAAVRRAIVRLPDVESLIFGAESRHEILREVDAVRDRALAAIDDFLDRRVQGQVLP